MAHFDFCVGRLWRPTPCIEGVIDRIELLRLNDGLKSSGLLIDLACGSGQYEKASSESN